MELGERLRALRIARGLSQVALGEYLGVDASTISRYETGKSDLDRRTVEKLSELFGVSRIELEGIPRNVFESATTDVPILGRIPAGKLEFTEQNIEGYWPVPEDMVRGGVHFFLRVEGNCMERSGIRHGDLALIRVQPEVEATEIAAVAVGEEGTLKRVQHLNSHIILTADDPKVAPIRAEARDVRILGKVIATIRRFP